MAPASAPKNGAADGNVVVRLSEVPAELREEMAHKAAERWGLRGQDYLALVLVARLASPDCELEVSARKAEQVLVRGKFPPGAIPRFD